MINDASHQKKVVFRVFKPSVYMVFLGCMYRAYLSVSRLAPGLSSLPWRFVFSALQASAGGANLSLLWRATRPQREVSLQLRNLFMSLSLTVSSFKIKQTAADRDDQLSIQQALCIAQTDPEPEAREQAMLALDT